MAKPNSIGGLDRGQSVSFGKHLTGEARETCLRSATGKIYVRLIEVALAQVAAGWGAPKDEDGAAAAERAVLHTEQGRALKAALKAVSVDPGFEPPVRAAAARVAAAVGVVPGVRARTQDRAANAEVVQANLRGLGQELASLPPTIRGATFAAELAAWCRLGFAFKEVVLADARRNETMKGGREVGIAVMTLNGLFSRFRASLADEIAADETLPRDLQKELFRLYDSYVEARRAKHTARNARKAAAERKAAEKKAPTGPPAAEPPAAGQPAAEPPAAEPPGTPAPAET